MGWTSLPLFYYLLNQDKVRNKNNYQLQTSITITTLYSYSTTLPQL